MYTVDTTYTDLSPNEILRLIWHEYQQFKKYRTYIIMGRTGPTGKTWLCRGLNSMGFKAIELSENIYDLVDYTTTDKNVYRICDDVGIIVLNQRLPWFDTVKGELE